MTIEDLTETIDSIKTRTASANYQIADLNYSAFGEQLCNGYTLRSGLRDNALPLSPIP